MKPILLHLKNIGPFRDETIDFSQLGDMFLICGKTGAGKSTIFNAPKNINAISTQWESVPSFGVIPNVSPTVPIADAVS